MNERVAIGVPVLNGAIHLAESLESLLSQTFSEIGVVVVDNCSTDGTGAVAERYAALDPRLVYVQNNRTVGLAENWRRAFLEATGRFPEATFFAWGSDHDIWHPRFVEALVAELERDERIVLAYPESITLRNGVIDVAKRGRHALDTVGVDDARRRLEAVVASPAAGYHVYGLMRAGPLAACGVFPDALLPDRLLLTKLALAGQFRHVPRLLWFRRHRAEIDPWTGEPAHLLGRQRRRTFSARPPVTAYLPWWLTHTAHLYGALRRSADGLGTGDRGAGAHLTRAHLRASLAFELRRRVHRARKRRRARSMLRRAVGHAVSRRPKASR